MRKIINLSAPAKINLSLRILGKLGDGYHEIETLFVAVGLFDKLKIQLQDHHNIILHIKDSNIPGDNTNLCFRAAELFSKHNKNFSGCDIYLSKVIPDGAGLGGGSSDAASTLLGLNELYGSPLDQDQLCKIAIQLGADVPFFLSPGLAIGRGKGEVLEYLKLKWNFWILIVCPSFKISTQWAYSNYKIGLTNVEKNIILNSHNLNDLQLDFFSKFFENDFESLVFSNYPELKELKQRIYEEGASFAGLSGSGSTVFGLFGTQREAEIAEAKFKEKIKTLVVKIFRTHSI